MTSALNRLISIGERYLSWIILKYYFTVAVVNFPRIFYPGSNWSPCDDCYYHDAPFPASVNKHVWYKINTAFCATNYRYSRKKAINVKSKCVIKLPFFFPDIFGPRNNMWLETYCRRFIILERKMSFNHIQQSWVFFSKLSKKLRKTENLTIFRFDYLNELLNKR